MLGNQKFEKFSYSDVITHYVVLTTFFTYRIPLGQRLLEPCEEILVRGVLIRGHRRPRPRRGHQREAELHRQFVYQEPGVGSDRMRQAAAICGDPVPLHSGYTRTQGEKISELYS